MATPAPPIPRSAASRRLFVCHTGAQRQFFSADPSGPRCRAWCLPASGGQVSGDIGAGLSAGNAGAGGGFRDVPADAEADPPRQCRQLSGAPEGRVRLRASEGRMRIVIRTTCLKCAQAAVTFANMACNITRLRCSTAEPCPPDGERHRPSARSTEIGPRRFGLSRRFRVLRPMNHRGNRRSPAPCSSRSTKNGPPTGRPATSGNAQMGDPSSAEFPDLGLLNPLIRSGSDARREKQRLSLLPVADDTAIS